MIINDGVLTYVGCSECDCVRVVPSIVGGANWVLNICWNLDVIRCATLQRVKRVCDNIPFTECATTRSEAGTVRDQAKLRSVQNCESNIP